MINASAETVAELPVGFGCRVAGYSFTWTIRVATGEVGG